MITVNHMYAECMFANLWGLGDVPEAAKPDVLVHGEVPNKNVKLKHVFDTYVVPYVSAWDAESLAQAKLAMRHLLTFEPEKAARHFDRHLPPCDAPEPATLIFEWVWDALFPDESWHLDRSQEYEVVNTSQGVNITVDPSAKIPSAMVGVEYSDYQWKSAPT